MTQQPASDTAIVQSWPYFVYEDPDTIIWCKEPQHHNQRDASPGNDRSDASPGHDRSHEKHVRLANFSALITADVYMDDGVESRREYEITVADTLHFRVAADEFDKLRWIAEHVGPGAILASGNGLKDRLRHAIQTLSLDLKATAQRRVFAHTGWREIDGKWVYLHAGVNGIEVDLPTKLQAVDLPTKFTADEERKAVRASLRLLEMGPLHVMVVPYAIIWRAILGDADLSVHIFGETGVFKTEMSALVQRHFGTAFHARALPENWSSTANAIEDLLFVAKDMVTVIDEFVPSSDGQRGTDDLERKADRIFRAVGNTSGRSRMRSDASRRDGRPPRGIVLSTGEALPGHNPSRLSRLLINEVGRGAITPEALTACQGESEGYVVATAGYIAWLGEHVRDIKNKVEDLREQVPAEHARVATNIAQCAVALGSFFDYAVEIGALGREDRDTLAKRCWAALLDVANAQTGFIREANPAERFLRLIVSAIVSGEAHLAGPDGLQPPDPQRWGWNHGGIALPRGALVGWVVEDDVYLDADSAYRATMKIGDIGVGLDTLKRRLYAQGLLASTTPETETQDHRLTVSRTLGGSRQRAVLHLRADALTCTDTVATLPAGMDGSLT